MKESIYINTGIAERLGTAYRIYAALLSIDVDGSGRVTVTLADLASLLNRSKQTIKRNLKKGQAFGLYHYLLIKDGYATCNYVSTKRLDDGSPDPGLRGKAPTCFVLNHLKLTSVWLDACMRTRRHELKLRHLPRRRANDEMFGKRVITYEDTLRQCDGVLVRRGGGLVITNPNLVHAGASQQAIADSLGRHRVTINKRLKQAVESIAPQPHKRVHRYVPISSLPVELQDQLYLERRVGRYSLGRNHMAWENSTCIYPLDPWAIPDPGLDLGVDMAGLPLGGFGVVV
jgi:hypothetical protein